jgi:regulatory protein
VGVRDKTRVNVFIAGRFVFSLALTQIADNGVKVGMEVSEEEERRLKGESEFSKAYQWALQWVMMRPRSTKELEDYLMRKSRPTKRRGLDRDGNLVMRESSGLTPEVVERVKATMLEKGYVDNEKFARYFIESWRIRKGASRKWFILKLREKGVEQEIAERVMQELEEQGRGRDDMEEIQKIIAKKRRKYDDWQMTGYLVKQGFNMADAKRAIEEWEQPE